MTEQAKPKPTQYIAVAPDHGYWQRDKVFADVAIRELVRRVSRDDRDLRVVLYHAGDEFEIDCFSIRSAPLINLGERVIPKKVLKAIVDANDALDETMHKLWGDALYGEEGLSGEQE